MPNETISTEQAKLDRKLCQRSLYYLCKEVLGYKDMVPHVHGHLCSFTTDKKYGRFRQATVPRSWFKTWVLTVGKAIWLTLPDEDGLYQDIYPYKGANVRILIASNVIDNAAKMVFKIKQEWMHNERLQAAFPELIPDFNKTRWSDHVAEVVRTINATEGTYTAVGVGGSVISQHFDHIIEDDLVYARKDDFTGQELMPSQEDIDNAIGWHKLSYSLLANPKTGCIDNTGTRWAPQDMINYIRKFEKQYACMELAATRGAEWPIMSDEQCIWPERYDKETLETICHAQGMRIFECFPAEAPILLSNWECKPIKDIKLGDEVVGFVQGKGQRAKLVKSTVNLVETTTKKVVKVTLASGNTVLCTEDHPWFIGRYGENRSQYLPAKVGRALHQVYDCLRVPTAEDILDYRYLAGLIDGEGACNHGCIAIGQSKEANPDVYTAIGNVLDRLHITYKICKVNPNDTHVLRNWTVRRGLGESFVLAGGREVKADIIRFGKPAKTHRILKTIWDNPHNPIKHEDKVVAIENVGKQSVYAIGTTSGNYVAYGYATKNTQYLNRPRATEDIVFKKEDVVIHTSFQEYPQGLEYVTIVDLAGWGDSKGTARNVVLTGAVDDKHHIWISRLDARRMNPTEVIETYKAHSRLFKSTIYVEEVQYQRAIRHFSRQEMERTGEWFIQERLPYDGRKDAKNLRIRSLQPIVANGGLHVLSVMQTLLEELEFYPHSKTVDILDCMGYLVKVAKLPPSAPVVAYKDPFSVAEIEKELKKNASGITGLPFDLQRKLWKPEYERN